MGRGRRRGLRKGQWRRGGIGFGRGVDLLEEVSQQEKEIGRGEGRGLRLDMVVLADRELYE